MQHQQQPGFYVPGPPAGSGHVQQAQQQSNMMQQHPQMMPQTQALSGEMGGGGGGGDGGGGGGGGGGFGGGLANIGLGLYGAEKAQQWFNSNNNFLSKSASNVAILSSSVKYYFDIDNNYVVAKLRAVLVPFLNKNWERIPEQVAGGVTYKSGRQDVNAPDLYICVNGFVTYVLIVLFSHLASPAAAAATSSSGFSLFSSTAAKAATKAAAPNAPLVNGGTKVLSPTLASRSQATASKLGGAVASFNPDSMNIILWRSAMTWVFNFIVLRVALYMTNSNIKAALLDLASYSGYLFVYGSLCRLAGIFSSTAGMLVWLYMAAAYGLFLTKTMQRVMVLESRNYGVHVRQNNYVLMAVAIMQFVLLKWLMM